MRTICLCVAVIGLIGCTDGNGPFTPTLPPGAEQASQFCTARDQEVDVWLKSVCPGGIKGCSVLPTVHTMVNGQKVYIVDTGVSPFYKVEDYPVKWCK